MDDRREVIELVNKLQGYRNSTGCEINIELPQIVVVGAQSSGKSSVLDGLIGSSILPRGSGTVTKCPIIVQLITTTGVDEKGVEFQDAPEDGRIQNEEVIRAKITERMEKGGGAIKDEPIIIKVFSPNVVTLTVVDLPGIKRITASGEPDDLEKLIFDLSRKYINEKNAIILAVSPANYDICNSDGIVLAREADPSGDRTIGVLTKLDLMDEGTNARSLLTGTSPDVNVKLGMIGLVNRSQKDIDEKMTVKAQLKKEKMFLEDNYPDLADTNGVPFLRKRLHELLVQHIWKCLPEIMGKMVKLLEDCQARIEAVPDVIDQTDKYRFVNKVIQGFESCMRKEIEGSTRNPEYKHLYGGIRIKDLFEQRFANDMLNAGMRSNQSVTDQMIVTAFRNSGAYDSLFVYPEAVFRMLAQQQIQHIEEPALNCAEKVHDQIVKIADRYLANQKQAFEYFPEFRKSIKSVVHGMLENKLDSLRKEIKDYIQIQSSGVNSLDTQYMEKVSRIRRELEKSLYGHTDYVEAPDTGNYVDGREEWNEDGNLNMVVQPAPRRPWGLYSKHGKNSKLGKLQSNSNEVLNKLKDPTITDLIKKMVNLHFNHVKMQIQDYIPKLVAKRLITQFSSEEEGSLGTELRVHVMKKFDELATLPVNVSEMRVKNVKMKEHLKEVIGEIKGILNTHKYTDPNDCDFEPSEDEEE